MKQIPWDIALFIIVGPTLITLAFFFLAFKRNKRRQL